MHVTVDARLAFAGGIGTYLRNVIPRIAEAERSWRFTLLGSGVALSRTFGHLANVAIVECKARSYSIRQQFAVRAATPRNTTVFWAPHYDIPLTVSAPLVVTVHDLIHLAVPEATRGFLPRVYARFMFGRVRAKAAAVMYDSEFTAREMQRLIGRPAGVVSVVPLAVDDSWSSATAHQRPIEDPYLVYVGHLKLHKNIPLLLRAFSRVAGEIPQRLVIVGRSEGITLDHAIAGEMAKLNGRVTMIGEVDDATLRQYVRHADALVTASLYEGFGLPPLEAMRLGCACLVSNAGSLPEVCGDAALYCDPRSEGSVADGLKRIATDTALRQQLVVRGRDRAAQFSWTRTAESVARVLESAAAA